MIHNSEIENKLTYAYTLSVFMTNPLALELDI